MLFEQFEVTLHNFGYFRLDGGAMFGAVPKNLWARSISPDDQNRIKLATRCMRIRAGDRTFLIDVGCGDKWTPRQREIFAIESISVKQAGIEDPEEITDVILTHLHFDHGGGISRYNQAGALELTYPKATVHIQEDNLKTARQPNVREKASYLRENVEILEQAKLNIIRGNKELYPGIWVHQVNGHTRGQQWIEVKGKARSLVYATDLVPTAHHLPLPYNMGYDICTETLLREKEELLSQAIAKKHIIVFEHDVETEAALIAKDERGHYCVAEKIAFFDIA